MAWVSIDEKGIEASSGEVLVEVDARYFRPTEVDLLVGGRPRRKRGSAGGMRNKQWQLRESRQHFLYVDWP